MMMREWSEGERKKDKHMAVGERKGGEGME